MRPLIIEAHKLSNKNANDVVDRVEGQIYMLVNVESGAHWGNSDEDGREAEEEVGYVDEPFLSNILQLASQLEVSEFSPHRDEESLSEELHLFFHPWKFAV